MNPQRKLRPCLDRQLIWNIAFMLAYRHCAQIQHSNLAADPKPAGDMMVLTEPTKGTYSWSVQIQRRRYSWEVYMMEHRDCGPWGFPRASRNSTEVEHCGPLQPDRSVFAITPNTQWNEMTSQVHPCSSDVTTKATHLCVSVCPSASYTSPST